MEHGRLDEDASFVDAEQVRGVPHDEEVPAGDGRGAVDCGAIQSYEGFVLALDLVCCFGLLFWFCFFVFCFLFFVFCFWLFVFGFGFVFGFVFGFGLVLVWFWFWFGFGFGFGFVLV